jgi:uncharacterized protein
MKHVLLISGMLLLLSSKVFSQLPPYNVVIDVTTKDTNTHKAVIRWCHEIIDAHPEAKVEVVYYAQSLEMVTQGKSAVPAEVTGLAGKNIAFRVCAIAMKRWNLDKSQLLQGVQSVPDGIYEILLKQKEGYAYIKASL